MPHSIDDPPIDDPPSSPPADSAGNEAPSPVPQGAIPDGASEGVREEADAADTPLRRPRHRRRRRRRPPPVSSPEPTAGQEVQTGEAASAAPAGPALGVESEAPAEGQPPGPLRRRRRRRRGPPHDPGARPASAEGDGQTREAERGADGEQKADEVAPDRSEVARATPQDTTPREPFRRRHRPRRPPRPAASAEQRPGSELNREADGTRREGRGVARGPRFGGPRNRFPREARPGSGEPPGTGARERRGPAPGREGERQSGDRGRPNRGPHRDGSQDRRRGRGRDAPQKRVEPKLYALEAVVDRGFEDVAAEAEESGTRRVHWTIIKRTVADQKSGKPMSAVYVLQRDGIQSEFPNLGAARLAVNKTIIHPEKLTLSKAEHVAAKK